MSYTSLSDKDKKEMLAKVGLSSMEELFACIPKNLKLKRKLNMPSPLTEAELIRHFEDLRKKNTFQDYLCFLGAGAYRHFIPAVVDYLSSRGEFLSPYTPYQPELSQGTLQVIFEFQTLICQLTGMDIANASLYDGASGAAEAVLMADRLQGKSKILVARTLHPQYRKVIRTYTKNLGIKVEEIGYQKSGKIDFDGLEKKMDKQTSAVVFQSPNFLGVIEEGERISGLAHRHESLSIAVVAEPVSLGLLESPGESGADMVTGEGQSFGLPLSFGGPYLGFMACRKEFLRQFPGRIAGQTTDVEGKRGFVLALSTREQHIRRERATSNICTNQAWCALRATIFLETLGQQGLGELAWQNVQKAHYALRQMQKLTGLRQKFNGSFFNEFVIECSKDWSRINGFLKRKGVIGGLSLEKDYPELKNCALFCVTEMHKKEDIDHLIKKLKEALKE